MDGADGSLRCRPYCDEALTTYVVLLMALGTELMVRSARSCSPDRADDRVLCLFVTRSTISVYVRLKNPSPLNSLRPADANCSDVQCLLRCRPEAESKPVGVASVEICGRSSWREKILFSVCVLCAVRGLRPSLGMTFGERRRRVGRSEGCRQM